MTGITKKISNKLLRKLCCPVCKGEIIRSSKNLQCKSCKKQYPVINNIPIFIDEECAYDDFYSNYNFNEQPFGYSKAYNKWRKGKANREFVKHLKPGTVFDDGGGYGSLRFFVNENIHEYYNMDYSYEMIGYDRSKLRCIGKGEQLPYQDNIFDNVVSGGVLEHVQNKIKYLKEVYRVLDSDGVFVLNTPRTQWVESYKNSIWFWIPHLSNAWEGLKRRLITSNKYSPSELPEGVVDIPSDEKWLRNQLETIGFKIILQDRMGNFLFSFTHWFWRTFADIFINQKKYGHNVLFVCKKY